MISDGINGRMTEQGYYETEPVSSESLPRHSSVPSQSLSKAERLCNKRLFEELIASGDSFIKYPFRVVVKKSTEQNTFPARIAVSVSKKKFKRAVKRNRIKRLTREAYRLNKSMLYKHIPKNISLDILFIYIDNTIPDFAKIEKAIKNALKKIQEQFALSV